MKQWFLNTAGACGAKLHAFNQRREQNTERYHTTNLVLTLLFPIFIVCMAELNQAKYPSKLILFAVERPTVMIFNILIATLIFYMLRQLFKKGWIAVLTQSFVYMALSIVELFKYGTNGNHLILADMRLAKSVKSLKSFAYIKITPMLITYVVIVALFFAAVFWFNPKQKHKLSRRLITAGTCLVSGLCIVMVPAISTPVYALFDLDTTNAANTFQLNEKFDNNSFLAFFVQTTSESLANRLQVPEGYDEAAINTYLDVDVPEENEDDFIKPNVITVMSEAYADFRKFDQLGLDTDAYDGFDEVAAEGYRGTAIVPTFASYTVRTEFELMFGLPVRSLNDPNMPQRVLLEREQPTVVRTYKDYGYDTAYVHPFLRSFYSRSRVYARFGFDQMIFDDNFTVPVNYYGTYIEDKTVFNQIEQLLEDSDKPMYVHATTMQNHQPYNQGLDPDAEFDNYLQWIGHTSESLREFTNDLKKIKEPTIVLFVGDHFPSLKGENSTYDALGMNGSNCSILYEQSFVLWSNYDQDFSRMPDEPISTFYLPYVVKDLINAPKDSYTQAMLDKMKTLPVYATNYDSDAPRDSELDILTYDRILGDTMSVDEDSLVPAATTN